MSSFKALGAVAALSIGLLLSTAAQAHPKLLSSTPVDGATVAAPAKIELSFSEKLTTQLNLRSEFSMMLKIFRYQHLKLVSSKFFLKIQIIQYAFILLRNY